MKKIKRFDPKHIPFSQAMNEDNLGIYVKHEDYKELQSQLEAEKEDLKLPIEFIKHITGIKQKSLINKKWKEWLTSKTK